MSIQAIWISTEEGARRVWAVCHGQMALHPAPLRDGAEGDPLYSVTHIRTGTSILLCGDRDDARLAFKEVCGWGLDWDGMTSDPDNRQDEIDAAYMMVNWLEVALDMRTVYRVLGLPLGGEEDVEIY